MNTQLIYIAVDMDGTVLTVNTSRELCESYVMDFFGINPNKQYTESAIFEGYHKMHYSEFEDELDGYWVFRCTDRSERINLFITVMDKPI
jgi:hypothetical protein